MGKLADLKATVAMALGTVPELTDATIIAAKADVFQRTQEAVAKVGGLAAIVDVVDGRNENIEEKTALVPLRLLTGVSVTLWMIPIHLEDPDTQPPLTAGQRDPADVLEATLQALNGLTLSASIEGCPMPSHNLYVRSWSTIPEAQPYLVQQILCETTTQL